MARYIEIPEMWEEFTPEQFKYLLKSVFRMMADSTITKDDVLNDFADYLLGRKKFVHPGQKEKYLVLVSQLAEKFDWIFSETEDEQLVLNFETTQNLLPGLENLLGPQSHGSDFRFGEYRTAVEFYNKFTQEHNPADLDCLVGILYRKPNTRKKDETFDGNYREPFNKHLIGKYAARVKKIPEYIKWGVYLWFGYFCQYLLEGPFIIEGNEVCFSSIFDRGNTDQDEKKSNSIGMTAVLFSLADTGTFGNAKETDETELFKVLLKLLHDKNTLDELERKNK